MNERQVMFCWVVSSFLTITQENRSFNSFYKDPEKIKLPSDESAIRNNFDSIAIALCASRLIVNHEKKATLRAEKKM